VRRSAATGRTIAAVAIATAATLALPVPGAAEPNPPLAPVDALVSLAPAIIGAAAGPLDGPSPAQRDILDQARQLLADSALPPQIATILRGVITFLDGSAGGGPPIPRSGPPIAQFLYPSIGHACIADSADSVGTALAVPGPAKLPPPGPRAGQAGFVFTALGTKPPTPQQANPMTVTWLNLDTRRSQTQELTGAAHINPAGPSTLTAIADTGPGRVIAVISGGLTTQTGAAARSCTFLPTVGMFTVG
jgi:hypothetical protein